MTDLLVGGCFFAFNPRPQLKSAKQRRRTLFEAAAVDSPVNHTNGMNADLDRVIQWQLCYLRSDTPRL